ncbi:hypothetical protein BYT27DRAFT_7107615, partial [Phlegmacium glaucopus]
KMEVDNGFPMGAIVKARWIRVPKKWKEGQRFTHTILTIKGRTQYHSERDYH